MVQPAREMTITPADTEFPVSVRPPPGFDPDDLATWPQDPGRFEYVDGRLLYMPPCGDDQGNVAGETFYIIRQWLESHQDLTARSNEIGVMWGSDKRGIDIAVWRRADLSTRSTGFIRVPPVLAVEVAGQHDREDYLRDKAGWYLERGVTIVWLVLPDPREVVVLTGEHEVRYGLGASLAPHEALPGLAPAVSDFFRQLG